MTKCPLCSQEMLETQSRWYCDSCTTNVVIHKKSANYTLTEDDIDAITNHRVSEPHEFRSSTGLAFYAALQWDAEHHEVIFVSLEHNPFVEGVFCPVHDVTLWVSADRYYCPTRIDDESRCAVKFWRNHEGHKITPEELKTLLLGVPLGPWTLINSDKEPYQAEVVFNFDDNELHTSAFMCDLYTVEVPEDDDEERSALDARVRDLLGPFWTLPNPHHDQARSSIIGLLSAKGHNAEAVIKWIERIPVPSASQVPFDIEAAREILLRHHAGDDWLIGRLISEIYSNMSQHKAWTKPLLLIGPPGVGKTTIAEAYAEALGRCLVRIDLGGLNDPAALRGIASFYEGATPGLIMQRLINSGSSSPVILLDEIDKLGSHSGGYPIEVFLSLFDPSRNGVFVDDFFGIPCDLSRVIWIATANYQERIPEALLDRCSVIEIPPYDDATKAHLAREVLIPEILRSYQRDTTSPWGTVNASAGFSGQDPRKKVTGPTSNDETTQITPGSEFEIMSEIEIDEDAIGALIDYDHNEPGLRKLRDKLERVISTAIYEHRRATHITITTAFAAQVLGVQVQVQPEVQPDSSQPGTLGYL
ncbi:MAG: AAA family ATPase [Ferrimicrobium sp.]